MFGFKSIAMIAAALVMSWSGAQAQQPARSFQGNSLLGEPMYTEGLNPANATDTASLLRAVSESKTAVARDPSIDNFTWHGRMVGYQLLAREAIAIYTDGLKLHPNSAKLLRHRAHRYFNLREFDRSIADGLKAAALYEGEPLEREKMGPDYFPGTRDVVQFYLYYHLGGAYFAKHDYANAEKWFDRAHNTIIYNGSAHDFAATIYWRYLCLTRLNRVAEAKKLLDQYNATADQLSSTGEAPYYFEAIQLFKGNRSADDFYTDRDSGRPFGTADGMKASTSYTLANYWLIRGERDKAREWLARAISVKTWAYFPRIQAEADWVHLFGQQKP
jgi:tetratricopeptide (TPR) repeat protein